MDKNRCRECLNTKCQDRCNPSSCEHFTPKPLTDLEAKQLQIENTLTDRGV